MQKRVVLVSAAVAALGLAAAVAGFVAEATKSKASFRWIRGAALRVPAHAGALLRRRRGAARAGGAGPRHRRQRLLRPQRAGDRRPPPHHRRQAVDRRVGAGVGGGGDVPLRRGAEPGRDAGPLHEQAGPALRPRLLLLRLRRAQERHLLHRVHLVRRRRGVRYRGIRLPPAGGRLPVPGGTGPVRRAGRGDGAAAVVAAIPTAGVPPASGLPAAAYALLCSSAVRRLWRLRRQATCGDSLTSVSRFQVPTNTVYGAPVYVSSNILRICKCNFIECGIYSSLHFMEVLSLFQFIVPITSYIFFLLLAKCPYVATGIEH